jgi:hypothetical protein
VVSRSRKAGSNGQLTASIGATAAAVPKEGEDKQFNGSCLVAKASSKEEVLEELRKDIYAQEGVWNLEKVFVYSHHCRIKGCRLMIVLGPDLPCKFRNWIPSM